MIRPLERYRVLLGAMLLFAATGCGKPIFHDLESLQQYVTDPAKPFLKEVTAEGVIFSLQYLPPDLMMKNRYKIFFENKEKLTKNEEIPAKKKKELVKKWVRDLEKRKAGYEKNLYFKMKIGFTKKAKDLVYGHRGNYSRWLNTLLFGMKNYIALETNKVGEIPLSYYHMIRTFGMTKSRSFMLVFPSHFNGEKIEQASHLSIYLEEFGLKTGLIKFNYELPFSKVSFKLNTDL
jgi:hypothetical protein